MESTITITLILILVLVKVLHGVDGHLDDYNSGSHIIAGNAVIVVTSIVPG